MVSVGPTGAPTGPVAGDLGSGFWMSCGCLGSASRLAVVPLAALMGLPASTPATLRESADDSFASPERAVLGVSSPGDGLDPPSTCYQHSAQSEHFEGGKKVYSR